MSMENKKKLAKELYTKTNQTRKQIAAQIPVTEKTLRGWIEKYLWDDIKEAYSITKPQLYREALAQLAAINQKVNDEHNGIPNKQLSDAKGVLIKELNALADTPLHQYIEVATEFGQFLSTTYPAETIPIMDRLNDWIEKLAHENKIG